MERINPPGHNPEFHHPEIWCSSISDLEISKNEIDGIAGTWITDEMKSKFRSFFIQPSVAEEIRYSNRNDEPLLMPGIASIQIPQVIHNRDNFNPQTNTILIEDQTGELEIKLPDFFTLLAMNVNRRLKFNLPSVGISTIAKNTWKGDVGFFYHFTRSSGMRFMLTFLRENQILSRDKEKVLFEATMPSTI